MSAPRNPMLLNVLHMIRQRFSWKIQSTLDLTGPGVFSDAVHEFLEDNKDNALVEAGMAFHRDLHERRSSIELLQQVRPLRSTI